MIERRHRPSGEVFRREYLEANRPVMLSGLLDDWPAMRRWARPYLRAAFGGVDVEVMADRDYDPRYELNCEAHRKLVPGRDYIDRVFSGAGNDQYMVANNKFTSTEPGRLLLGDVIQWPEYLEPLHPVHAGGSIFLWIGPDGTVTPLHRDVMDIMFCQVVGRKRFALIAPDQTPNLYNRVGVFSDVNYEIPDLKRYPAFAEVRSEELTLVSGDVLFIPVGWFHHVRSLSPSVSVSFTNLRRQ